MDTIGNLKKIGATVHLSTAGGGGVALSDLCSAPGRSSVILGATFINDTNMFNKYIGVETWSKYASHESAKSLSIASQEAGKNGLKHIGIGIASSLATNNERVGRVNVTNIVATGYNFEVSFTKEFVRVEEQTPENERHNQEDLIKNHLNEILYICYEILEGTTYKYTGYEIKILHQSSIVEDSINVYPGSFNPVHKGHITLKKLSEEITGNKTYLEISLPNFEKRRIDLNEVSSRVNGIDEDVLVSYDKTFVEKYFGLIKKYPHLKRICFVCGVDTWDRISVVDRGILQSTNKVKFLVFARNGLWISPEELERHQEMIEFDNRLKSYNNDISSSKIRAEKLND